MKSVDEKINFNQLLIINKIKVYLKELKKKNIDTSKSSFCNFSTYSESPGFSLIQLWIKKINKAKFVLNVLKNIYSILYLSDFQNSSKSKKKFKNIILTWGNSKDFNENYFKDKYSSTKSNLNKNTLYFVIYLDHKIPKKIPKNVVLYFQKNKKINFRFFFNHLFKNLIFNSFSLKKFIHYFSYQTIFADQLLKHFFLIIDVNYIDKVIMPYEAQCFQNLVYKEVYNFNPKIKTIGFINAMVPAFPINFIKRNGSPKILYLSGSAQLNVFYKYLNWKKKDLKIIESFRISKKINKKDLNSIFFPITLKDQQQIIKALENFIKSKKDNCYNYFNIKKHPSNFNNKNQIKFYNSVYNLLKRNINKFSSKSKKIINIYIGPTSSLIQYLENDIVSIHITTDPEFDVYSYGLWENLRSKKIDQNIYTYELIRKNKMIKLNTGNKNLNNLNFI